MTIGELFGVLQSGDWTQFIGKPENDQIDFKKAPYQLDSERQKWELAKDVAAFANAGGGAIAIGLETKRHPHEVVDTVVEVRPVAKSSIQADRYEAVLDSWVVPRPSVRLHWFPADPSVAQGLFVIEVTAQADHSKPVLIRRSVDSDGTKFDAVAVPRRDGARVVWESSEELQRQLADRRRMLSMVGGLGSGHQVSRGASDAEASLDDALTIQDWSAAAVYFLQAIPTPASSGVPGLYEEIPEALSNPPLVRRRGGFAERWRINPEIVEGGVLIRGSEGITWVARTGLVTEGHLVHPDSVLGWFFNQDAASGDAMVLHPLAAVEVTLEFFRFVSRELHGRLSGSGWQYRIVCRNLRSGNVVLPQGHPDTRDDALYSRRRPGIASSDDWCRDIAESGSPQRNAYLVLVELYALFGLEPHAIPYVEEGLVSEPMIAAKSR